MLDAFRTRLASCGGCGSRLIVSFAKNRWGTVYPYFICLGRQQRRTTCTQQAIRIDATEEAVAAHYGTVELTEDEFVQIRVLVLTELMKLRTDADRERLIQERRLRNLRDERQVLLKAHYANAVPLDLLKSEQDRIAAEIAGAESRLEAVAADFKRAEANLHRVLELAGTCEAAYKAAPAAVRRQFNQVFFKRLLIDDQYGVTGELAEPFDVLLSAEMKEAAAAQTKSEMDAEAELGKTVEAILEGREEQPEECPTPVSGDKDLVGAGMGSAYRGRGFFNGQGLKLETLVHPRFHHKNRFPLVTGLTFGLD